MFDMMRSVANAGRHRSSGRSRHTGRHRFFAAPLLAATALVASLVLLGPAAGRVLGEETLRPQFASDVAPLPGGNATAASDETTPTTPLNTDNQSDETTTVGVHYATGTVTRVVDGDTVEVSGVAQDVRVLGIDTPEPGTAECWNEEATAFAEITLAGQTVDLHIDPTQATFDRFGRLLAYVILPDATNYSIAAGAAGAARQEEVFNDMPVLLAAEITAAVEAAQQSDLGLWGPPCNENE
jgi:micrococcal nuclease